VKNRLSSTSGNIPPTRAIVVYGILSSGILSGSMTIIGAHWDSFFVSVFGVFIFFGFLAMMLRSTVATIASVQSISVDQL
jgi:hypothetical protein